MFLAVRRSSYRIVIAMLISNTSVGQTIVGWNSTICRAILHMVGLRHNYPRLTWLDQSKRAMAMAS